MNSPRNTGSIAVIVGASVITLALILSALYFRSQTKDSPPTEETEARESQSSEDPLYDRMVQALRQLADEETSPLPNDAQTATEEAISASGEWGETVRTIARDDPAIESADLASCDLLSGEFEFPENVTGAMVEWKSQPEADTLFQEHRAYIFHSTETDADADVTQLQSLVSGIQASVPNCETFSSSQTSSSVQQDPYEFDALADEGYQSAAWEITSSISDDDLGSGLFSVQANRFTWNRDFAIFLQLYEAPQEERTYTEEEEDASPAHDSLQQEMPETTKTLLDSLGIAEPDPLPNIQPPPDAVPDDAADEGDEEDSESSDESEDDDSDDAIRDALCDKPLLPVDIQEKCEEYENE
ncbi:hypothetical protein [Brevibacterium sp. S22]|uniref:hypothetical protein n=1 Tax=Brevibacterium sp. S22 TaxID=2483794 RepID=UPI001091FAA3|nr:hypothetical protein [Brevibacterium sp. S22]